MALLQKDKSAQTAKGNSFLVLSMLGDKEVDSSGEFSTRLSDGDNVLDQNLWKTLPTDILKEVLTRLPFSARCRLRWVCRNWKENLLVSPYRNSNMPPCMIWSRLGFGNPRFFCQADKQWFSLPSTAFTIPLWSELPPSSGTSWEVFELPPLDGGTYQHTVATSVFTIPSAANESSGVASWELVDTDAGLLCYQRCIEGSFWLCVSNPLTSFSRVIPPDYNHAQLKSNPHMLKLLVDREKKTFKVILVFDQSTGTAVYNSTTAKWLLPNSHPDYFYGGFTNLDEYDTPKTHLGIHPSEMFVWKDVVYAYTTLQDELFGNVVMAFCEDLGDWANIHARFPRENKSEMKHFVLSDKEQVLLVQFCSKGGSSFSISRLMDDGLSPLEDSGPQPGPNPWDESRNAKFLKWEKVFATSTRSLARRIGVFIPNELGHVCYGAGHIYFMFRGNENKVDGFRMHRCLRFSLVAKSWEVVLCPTGWKEPFKLYHWKPSVDVNPILMC